nr:neprilysin-21-like [Rhipicephalus microplus]
MENKLPVDSKTEKGRGGDQQQQQQQKKKRQTQLRHPMMRGKKIADKPGKQRDKRKEEIGVESVKDKQTSDKQAAANQQELSPPAPAAPTRTAVVAFVTVSVLSCILVLSSTLLILQYLRAPIVGTCTTAGCIAQAEAILNAMNASVKPCSDFYRFSCGSWKPRGPYRSMIEQIFAKSFAIAIKELEENVSKSVLPIAQRYYQSCTAKRSDDLLQSEIQKFAKFKRDLGLLWPEEWPEKSNVAMPPLKVLVNLTVNWNVNLIFNVRVIPGYKGRPRSIFLQRGVLGPSWSVYKPDEMKRSIEEHCQFLRAQAPTPVLLKEIMKAYLAVVNASLSFEPDARDEEKTTLKEINERTESGKDKWEEYMKETLPDFVWRPEDVVLIQHPAILDNIGHLLESMSDKSLRLGIAWVFVYLTFWTVVGKPHLLFEGSAEELEVREKYACLSHVASTFGLVVSHDHLLKRFTDDVRLHIDTVFKTIKAAYQRAFADADWIDESVKTKLKAKVSESLTLNSLPGSEFFSNFAIAAVYKHFPNATSSFFDNFVNIAKSFRKKLSSDDFVNAFSKTLGDGHVATSYSYYYNTVYFAVGALESPMFHVDSTFSSTYGSMGTLMASSMARAFDERGIVFDRGEVAPWWIADRKEYERRLKCDLGAGRSRSDSGAAFASPLFWAALGLRTSYDAYRSAIKVRKTVDIFRIKGLEKYSDDQVFFMSYCLITCAIDSNGDACNIPVRQSSKFAVAFRCPEKAPMNPRERCPFL